MTSQSGEDDYDGPWKAAIERFTEPFMALLFPAVHAGIDWSLPLEFLDQELQALSREASLPKGIVDRLIKARSRSGDETWVLLHIEVQAQRDPRLPERMFAYYYRIFDRHARQPVSLAVLADDRRGWRPRCYHHERWGCELRLEFPAVKLLDLGERWEDLEGSDNPFAAVVMAHLKTQATRGDPEGRARWKLALARRLLQRGWSRNDILDLYWFIDWLMALPEELQRQHEATWQQEHGEQAMPYMTIWEQKGMERGLKEGKEEGLKEGKEEGLKEGVIDALEVRFGAVPDEVLAAVRGVSDLELLGKLLRQAIVVESLAAFAQLLPEQSAQ